MATVRRGCILLAATIAIIWNSANAFVSPQRQRQIAKACTTTARTRQKMSSVPSEDSSSKKKPFKFELPPPPEDQLVMTGDVAALFVYSFLDHSLAEAVSNSLLSSDATPEEIAKSLDYAQPTLPVWADSLHFTGAFTPEKLMVLVGYENFGNYSPVISSAGSASVLLVSCWLFSGYLNNAFLFRNTVECNMQKALEVTGKTWLMTMVLMVLLALGSDYVWGNCDSLHSPSLGGLTKADADFIFDSLTVLVTWRVMVSMLLGYGK